METDMRCENGNGNLQSGNENGIFHAEMETKWNGVFRWNKHGNGTFQTTHNDTMRMDHLRPNFYYHTCTQLDPIRNCPVLLQYSKLLT